MSPARNSPRKLGLDVDAEAAGERLRDLEHGGRHARADVDRAPVAPSSSSSASGQRPRDVADVDEVAGLPPVLEDQRGRPLSSREAKIAATPVYGFESACRGP